MGTPGSDYCPHKLLHAPHYCTLVHGGHRASRRESRCVDAVRGRERDVSLSGRCRPPRVGASGPLGSAGRDALRERRRQPRGNRVRRGASASAWGGLPRKGASVVSVHQCRTAPRGNGGVDRAKKHRVHPTGRDSVRCRRAPKGGAAPSGFEGRSSRDGRGGVRLRRRRFHDSVLRGRFLSGAASPQDTTDLRRWIRGKYPVPCSGRKRSDSGDVSPRRPRPVACRCRPGRSRSSSRQDSQASSSHFLSRSGADAICRPQADPPCAPTRAHRAAPSRRARRRGSLCASLCG